MKIKDIQNEIVDEFSFFDDWEQRYEYLIELGKSLNTLSEEEKTDDKIIKGCQSSVWLDAEMKGDIIEFRADSNAILPKGIAALLIRMYNNQTPKDILDSDTDFISEIGLSEFLSPTRANGLLAMVKQFKFYAIAFNAKQNT
ncbi:Cysteine desulfuration protein SufE [Chishuiella changwenlii]|jgi:cysteine desulfuration protein SufE|uniref:Cysteine desulfuration protein SufE n=1 Tax=Chishuiella changwenlii TaxID=1434701 RepID=A0A1M6YRP9_9FLAO|nr:SufE family protein [Chishuiella changwenlii]GGE88442.1 Fe-S metabolism protein SufE [Chishuiella changwenlii]SHL20956.1 Cysteine desulfuration protein SufE [Chishuiella changwenlii]